MTTPRPSAGFKYTGAMNDNRRIAHLDMDAFFASVELLSYPQLRGLPVVVGGRNAARITGHAREPGEFARLRDYVGRGVVTTSTYEARALGVFSGMGLMKSALLAPDAILLPANFEAYRHYSRLFKSAVASCAPLIEDRGIDEIYIDLSAINQETITLARSIKQAVTRDTGLTCSIGVAPNKLLAKICSDLEKPDGLTVLSADDIPTRIWPLPVRKVNGIGPKANEKLATLGIRTIGELAATDAPELVRHFGRSTGEWLARVARGIDDRPLVTESEPKSISRETTFERDLHARHDRAQLSEVFTQLCVRLADDLRRKGYSSRTVGVKVKYADFRVLTRDLSVHQDLTDATEIRKVAGECLKRVPLEQRIRLLGVRLGALHPLGENRESALPIQPDLPF